MGSFVEPTDSVCYMVVSSVVVPVLSTVLVVRLSMRVQLGARRVAGGPVERR